MAVVGLGHGAQRITLPALTGQKKVKIVAGCDRDKATAEAAAIRWGIPSTHSDVEEMLEWARPEVLVIATPPQSHHELALLGLSKGCHIFCEKPFMPSTQAAEEVIEVAQAKGLTVAVNEQYYQMPIYRRARREIAEGEVGRLYHIEAWQHLFQIPEEEGGWKTELGTQRVLFEFGTHAVDLFCHFFDGYPLAVTARTAKVREDVQSDACVLARFDFSEGRVANLVFNRASHAPKKYLEMRLDCEQAALRASLGGVARLEFGWNSERGRPRVEFGLTSGGELRLERDGRRRKLQTQGGGAFAEACRAHFAQFVEAARRMLPPMKDAVHAREVQRAVFAAYESIEQGGEMVKLGR